MQRIPEPDLMNDPTQALAYALADFSEPHDRFVALFRRFFPRRHPRWVLDLGCGTADVTIRFARAFPGCRFLGIDGAPAMLRHAHGAIAGARLQERIHLVRSQLPAIPDSPDHFDTLISNSLLHHLHDPGILWEVLAGHGRTGSAVLVMDLMRPSSRRSAAQLVQTYAGTEHEVMKQDFFASLLSAYTVDEVRKQLKNAGLVRLKAKAASDRHLMVYGYLE